MLPSSKQIQSQLKSILDSPAFQASDLLTKFLTYVVKQSLAGNNENIKAYNIAVEAFGRPASFDPQSDSIVRITASKLRKELNNYYNVIGVHDAVLIEIPKGKYVPEFSLKSEDTPKVLNELNSSKNKKSINIYKFVTVFLFLVIVTLLVIKFSPQSEPPINEKPAIILYEFQNLTSNINNTLWIDGLSEEIAVMCSRHAEIDIIGPIDIHRPLQNMDEITSSKNVFALKCFCARQ